MYENIGEKIQKLAKIVGWTMLVIGVLAWLSLITDKGYEEYNTENDVLGWVALISGGLSLVSSWFLYGFGQLVEDVSSIRYHLLHNTTNSGNGATGSVFKNSSSNAAHFSAPTSGATWTCTCGKSNPSYTTSCSCGINKRDIK